jgi:hypothetical protein
MRNNRKADMFLTDNQLPVYEGDMVKVFISKEGKISVHWYPRSRDFKTPDKTRLGGNLKYLRLEQDEYVSLENNKRLALMLQPTERIQIYRVAPERREPLLRLPIRGLPPGGYKRSRL